MRRFIPWWTLQLAVMFAGALALRAAQPAAADLTPEQFAQGVFDATNATRQAYGLPPLSPDSRLARASLSHAQAMAATGIMDHQVPGEPSLEARVRATGYDIIALRENLAYWPPDQTPESLVDAWMQDPVHRPNLLANDTVDMGVGVWTGPIPGGGPQVFWVAQDMGKEKAPPGKVKVDPLKLKYETSKGDPKEASFTVTNASDDAKSVLTVTIKGPAGSDYEYVDEDFQREFELKGGKSQEVKVRFKAIKSDNTTIQVTTNDPDQKKAIVVVLEGKLHTPKVEVKGTLLEFDTALGKIQNDSFTVRNVSKDPDAFLTVEIDGPDGEFYIPDLNFRRKRILFPKDRAIEVPIRFSGKKASESKVTITSNDPDKKTVIVTLKGSVRVPKVQVDSTDVTIPAPSRLFGLSYLGKGSFRVTNTGAAGSILSVSVALPQGVDFRVSPTGGVILKKGESEEFTVIFTRSEPGTSTAKATVKTNDPDNPTVVVSLTGTVPRAKVKLSQTELTFNNVKVGRQVEVDIEVSNVGEAKSILSGSAKRTAQQPQGSGAISIEHASFGVKAGDKPDKVRIRCHPNAAGAFSATVTFTAQDADDSPQEVKITGKAVP